VDDILSTASQILCNEVTAPIVISVDDMSLSMDPTRPTTVRCLCGSASSAVILPINYTQKNFLMCLEFLFSIHHINEK
jgi:hypothetical protein